MEGKWVRKPKDGASVVFIHGIRSSGEAAWRNANGAYWPELLKNEPELDALGIYIYTYQADIFSGNYRLSDVVDDLKERMRLDNLFDSKRIIFVCHSMGGIVVRKFLVERQTDLINSNIEIGLFLVASPSLGAFYANLFSTFAKWLGNSQAQALRFAEDNTWLNDLDKEFQNLKEAGKLKMKGKELIEDKFIVLKKLIRKPVVERFAGARYFGEPYKVSHSDHSSIAAPQDQNAIQHRLLCQFIKLMLPPPPPVVPIKWKPIEILWPDGSTMVMLPIYMSSSMAFFMSRDPITNKQYRAFVRDTRAQEPYGEYYDKKMLGWRKPFYPWQDQDFSDESLPVVCVSYHDAKHYCEWVGKLCLKDERKFVHRAITLVPLVRIWEFAAFGTSSPTLKSEVWLKQTSRIHHRAVLPAPVDTSGIRTNALGISDLFGNVWEWCSVRDETDGYSGPMSSGGITHANVSLPTVNAASIHMSDVRMSGNSIVQSFSEKRELYVELRGGSFLDDLTAARPFETASRLDNKENTRHSDLGFRICAKVPLHTLTEETRRYLSDNALETWD